MDSSRDTHAGIGAIEVVLACADVNATAGFFTERLGFVVDAVVPADDPVAIVVSGHGTRLRLERGDGAPGRLRIACRDPDALAACVRDALARTPDAHTSAPDAPCVVTAPGGTVLEFVDAAPPIVVPPACPSFVLSRLADATWKVGRAGMRYRDLVPDRQGGRIIASHIRIPDGGPVPDYVHFHEIRFQLIFCVRGWVRLAYEDQGETFVMHAGGCVLQPPRIRHRVLECSPGLEVVEVTCPATHATHADHALTLPNTATARARDFSGQRFVHHDPDHATWTPWRLDGWRARDIGIAAGTGGLASAHVARPEPGGGTARTFSHDAEFLFTFVLGGAVVLDVEGREPQSLGVADALVLPAGLGARWREPSDDLELLEVTAPATFETRVASDVF